MIYIYYDATRNATRKSLHIPPFHSTVISLRVPTRTLVFAGLLKIEPVARTGLGAVKLYPAGQHIAGRTEEIIMVIDGSPTQFGV